MANKVGEDIEQRRNRLMRIYRLARIVRRESSRG